jgi:hypothetical protein
MLSLICGLWTLNKSSKLLDMGYTLRKGKTTHRREKERKGNKKLEHE